MTSKPEMTKPKSGISRRTVVKGTAWAVPAVVVATAAPAMAASPVPHGVVRWQQLQAARGR